MKTLKSFKQTNLETRRQKNLISDKKGIKRDRELARKIT